MKRYQLKTAVQHSFSILTVLLLITGCRKDKTPEPSGSDENYFVIKDNPNDSVDHAIYEFYNNTGIASFYNDTIYKRRISDIDGQPRYAYVTLSLNKSLFAKASIHSNKVSSRRPIPAFLRLLEQDLLPRLPANLHIPSLFMVDSIWNTDYPIVDVQVADGWTSLHALRTVGLRVKDIAAMNSDEKRLYTASLFAGLAEEYLNNHYPEKLQKDFLIISRNVAKSYLTIDVYSGLALLFTFPPGTEPAPAMLGLLKIPKSLLIPDPPFFMSLLPRETDDIRAFLTAAFCYTPQEFADKYDNNALLLQKFSVIRNIAIEAGFKLPD